MIEKSSILKLTPAARRFWLGVQSVHIAGMPTDQPDRSPACCNAAEAPGEQQTDRTASTSQESSPATAPRSKRMGRKATLSALAAFALLQLTVWPALADSAATNSIAAVTTASLPDAGASLVRVFGALILVIAIFLGGVWLFRNWQRLATTKNGGAKLNLLEVKSLGQRQALYVVGYQQQRMLLASSPAGVTLVTHLPAADEADSAEPAPKLSFAEAFQHVLNRKQ